jgi:hypothetical protein
MELTPVTLWLPVFPTITKKVTTVSALTDSTETAIRTPTLKDVVVKKDVTI